MAYHSNVASRESQLFADGIRRTIVIERHHQYSALAFRQAFEALLQSVRIERMLLVFEHGFELVAESFEDALAPNAAAAPVDHHLSAGTQNEGREAVGLTNCTGPQLLQRHQQYVLNQIRGSSLATQMTKAVQPYARRKASTQLGLRCDIDLRPGTRDTLRERTVVFMIDSGVLHEWSIGAVRGHR